MDGLELKTWFYTWAELSWPNLAEMKRTFDIDNLCMKID